MKAVEKKKYLLMSKAVDYGPFQTSEIIHVKVRLSRILKQLVILKLLKGPNCRIKWLCVLAYKYQKTLAFRAPLDCLAAPAGSHINDLKEKKNQHSPFARVLLPGCLEVNLTLPRIGMTLKDPLMPNTEAVAEPVADPVENMVDEESKSGGPSETPMEPQSLDFYQALCLKGLPRRLHMPAPKRLCRPSVLRWIKPCCTRSCYVSLDYIVTFRYSRRQCSRSMF